MEAVYSIKDFEIDFAGISSGKHSYCYNINNGFFELFEYSLIKKANTSLEVIFDKQSDTFFSLIYQFKGYISFSCDRCLNEFSYPVNKTHTMFLKLEKHEDSDQTDEHIIYIQPHEHVVNIAGYIYEFMLLEIPLKKTCDLAGQMCNSAMLKMIEKHSKKNTDTLQKNDNKPFNNLKEIIKK